MIAEALEAYECKRCRWQGPGRERASLVAERARFSARAARMVDRQAGPVFQSDSLCADLGLPGSILAVECAQVGIAVFALLRCSPTQGYRGLWVRA